MNQQSPPASGAKKKRRTNAPNQRAAATANTAIRAMQDFGPHPMMNDKKENFMPRSTHQYQHNNLIASNPFEDPPQRSYDIPTGPPLLPPQFTANPTPRRGITPDQIGNMSYMGMRRMQQANQLAAMNPMTAPPNRFEHPPMPVVNTMNNMRSTNMPLGQVGNVNNMGMQGSMNYNHTHQHHHNPNHMLNTHMSGTSVSSGGMVNASSINNSGLAMNGSTMISPMTGLMNDSRSSPGNQMIGNHLGPMNPMMGNANSVNPMMNAPVLSPLMSPNHMNSALNLPPISTMNNVQPQQHYNQMNNAVGPMQRPPNMSMLPMNSTVPVSMMGSNNHLNNMNMVRPFNNASNVNMMNGNSLQMGPPMGHNMQTTMPGKPTGPEMNLEIPMLQPNLQESMTNKHMGIPDEKIFPPNQPIVFNNQNPNAPPISPCGICRREVQATDQAVFCESGCNFWFHRRCAGLTDIAFEMLMAEPYAEWVCDKCVTSKDIPLVKYKP